MDTKALETEIEILGTFYRVCMRKKSDDPHLETADGYCDSSAKTIVLCDIEREQDTVADLDVYESEVARHEIIHAFLSESGLGSSFPLAKDEGAIDWMAMQLPKIARACIKLGVM